MNPIKNQIIGTSIYPKGGGISQEQYDALAKAGEVAKTLDDIKMSNDYATQHTLTELICPNNVPNMAFGEGGAPAVRTGRAVKVGDVTYYEWQYVDQMEEAPETFYTDTIHVERNSPIYYEPGGPQKANLEGDKKVTIASEETLNASKDEIISAVENSGGDDSKAAFLAMKRIQSYLYGIEYQSLNYEAARAHLLAASVVPSACTTIRRGTEVGRNFDWSISHQVEFLVRTKAHNGRYATIGFCGALPTLTEEVVAGGKYREEYRWLPFYMQDGMNSEGLVASIHQLPDNATRSQSASGNTPAVEERERVSAVMLVRYILDNFKSALAAAEYIRDFVRVIPAKVDGKQLDCHYAIADKDASVYVSFEGDSVIIEQHAADDRFVMTNFRLAGTTLVDGLYDIEQSGIEDYGQGVERANQAIKKAYDSEDDMLSILTGDVNFTKAYGDYDRLTEFAGIEHDGVRATIQDTAALEAIQASAAALYQSEVSDGTLRENGDLWQTVHSVVYDVNAKTLRFVTQEIDGDTEPIVVAEPFAAGGGGISPEQYEALAKQGVNPEATNSAILEAINGMAGGYAEQLHEIIGE